MVILGLLSVLCLYLLSGDGKNYLIRAFFLFHVDHIYSISSHYVGTDRVKKQMSADRYDLSYQYHSPYVSGYLFHYVSSHAGLYFCHERTAVKNALKKHAEKIPIRIQKKRFWDRFRTCPALWVATRHMDSSYFYMGDMKEGKPHGIGAVYRRERELDSTGNTDVLLMRGYFYHGVPQGYIQIYHFFSGLESIFCCHEYQNEQQTDWQSAVNAVLIHLVYEGFCRCGIPEGQGILYKQIS